MSLLVRKADKFTSESSSAMWSSHSRGLVLDWSSRLFISFLKELADPEVFRIRL
jgi:hypothetical protein